MRRQQVGLFLIYVIFVVDNSEVPEHFEAIGDPFDDSFVGELDEEETLSEIVRQLPEFNTLLKNGM